MVMKFKVSSTTNKRSSGTRRGTHFSGKVVQKEQPAVKLVRPASYNQIQAIPIHRFNEEIDAPKSLYFEYKLLVNNLFVVVKSTFTVFIDVKNFGKYCFIKKIMMQ